MFRKLKSFLRNNSAVTALEYGVIAAAIVVAVAATVGAVGNNIKVTFNNIAAAL
ncbi:MAG TPA: Flp family type IVb pilin [Alphaproteobacteria bacterium]|nr:Flp family type IVb pilin [Alphaproteobacteria bacterium]